MLSVVRGNYQYSRKKYPLFIWVVNSYAAVADHAKLFL